MKRQVKNFSTIIIPVLERYGFKKIKGTDLSFTREQYFGFHYISFQSFNLEDLQLGSQLTCGIGVRHNEVDDIVNQLGHIREEKYRKYTTTVYRGLKPFPFLPERDKEYIIRSSNAEEDAGASANRFIEMFQNDAVIFFNKYSSLEECAIGLNEPIEAVNHQLFNSFPKRAYYGVTSVALSDPDRAKYLANEYVEFLRRTRRVDPPVYQVGRDKNGLDAVIERFDFLISVAKSKALHS